MSDPPSTRMLAAIDIGTNSVHLVVARAGDGNRFEVVAREREMVRLGSGSGDMKVLHPDAIDRGVAALARFRRLAQASGAEVRAVATSAVREAENRDELVRRARQEAGVDVEVVSGVEEARLIHLGVLQAVPVYDRRVLLVDIGGGSTELLVGRGAEVLAARSLKLGAIRLTDRFFRHEPLRPDDVDRCRTHVRAYLAQTVRELGAVGFDVAVGSSGTVLSVAEMALARRGEAARGVANVGLRREEVEEVVAALVAARTVQERRRIPGLEARRADIIVAGAVLLAQIMAELDVDTLVVSDYALREGIILDTLQRASDAALHHLGDIRARSVRHLAQLSPTEAEHAARAAALSLALFDATARHHELGEDCRELLEAAALLANVGLAISHGGHHLHSYYIIRHAEHLAGFTDREVELIAQVARYHRKSAPKAKHAPFAALAPPDQRVVRTLAGILRVGIALDRSYRGVVRSLTGDVRDGRLVVYLDTDGDDAELELYTAEERKGLLESALGLPVAFAVDRPSGG